jgi:hypothetical protein
MIRQEETSSRRKSTYDLSSPAIILEKEALTYSVD